MLVSTYYMDEAERCHEFAYIANGELLVHGTVDEVMQRVRLTTYTVPTGRSSTKLASSLAGLPGVDMVVPFGASLHVSWPRSARA